MRKIKKVWEGKGEEWLGVDYITDQSPEGPWQQWWGWLGLLPTSLHRENKTRGIQGRMKETANILGEGGYEIF